MSTSVGINNFRRTAPDRRGGRAEGISLRLLDLSVGNFLPLAMICFSFRAGSQHGRIYPPSQKTTAVRPWMNARGGPSALRPIAFGRRAEARRAPGLRSRSGRFGGVGKEGASADFAEELRKIPRAYARGGFILPALHWFKMGQDIEYKTIEAVIPRRFLRIMGILVSNFVRGISLAVTNPTQGAISESRSKSIQ